MSIRRLTSAWRGMTALTLAAAVVACTLDGHAATATETAMPRDATAAAARARAAIAAHDGSAAVRAAERAVALAPRDVDLRRLLGRAYLAEGRFASAEAALTETLALAPGDARARFALTLARLARGAAVQANLRALTGQVPAGDLALALALAGDRPGGIAMLTAIVRDGTSDARVRQNLALAFALDGRWGEAQGMAMQDTPPAALAAQLARWRALVAPGGAPAQVAAMFGAVPVPIDPGMPIRLARAMAPAAAVPVAVVQAAPPPALPVQIAVAPIAALLPMPGPLVPAATVPALLAAPPVVPSRARRVAPGPMLAAVRGGGFVVQLGAFSRDGAIDAAWTTAARLAPRLAGFTPVRGATRLQGTALVRLSIGGFADRDQASRLCAALKVRGQACFVRGTGGDAPLRWVRRDDGGQLALAIARTVAKA